MKTPERHAAEYVARLNAPWYRRLINKLLGRWQSMEECKRVVLRWVVDCAPEDPGWIIGYEMPETGNINWQPPDPQSERWYSLKKNADTRTLRRMVRESSHVVGVQMAPRFKLEIEK